MKKLKFLQRKYKKVSNIVIATYVIDLEVKMTQWEYKTLEFDTKGFWVGGIVDSNQINEQLNKAGMEGWELVSMVTTNQYQGASRKIIAVFKRKKSSSKDTKIIEIK